jgi:hypothetical protein
MHLLSKIEASTLLYILGITVYGFFLFRVNKLLDKES